jgi:hypothetical protein
MGMVWDVLEQSVYSIAGLGVVVFCGIWAGDLQRLDRWL